MIKTLVFHIGDPKNGSSSIQRALFDRRWRCDQVRIAPQQELNASGLANTLLKDNRPERRRKLFRQKRDWARQEDADIGVISAEFFAKVRPRLLQRCVHEYLPEYAEGARVLAYVRPHAAWVASAYGTRVKTGGTLTTLSDFAAQISQRPFLDYYPRFERWKSVFGSRFTLRPFVPAKLHQGDVVADFFHQILEGAPFALQEAPTSANSSLSVEEITAMRVIQETWGRLEVPKPLRLALGGALGRTLEGLPEGCTRSKLRLDQASAGALRTRFIEDARALDNAFFGKPLMEAALDGAVESALPEPQSLEAEAYFTAAQLVEMQEAAAALVPPLRADPQAWRNDYRFRKAPGSKYGKAAAGIRQRQHIDDVWAQLNRLAGLMGKVQSEDKKVIT
ncbi:hypothetical protein K3722_21780 (plasmid) [Leisingera caerulea]|uniref:Sulfotransferase family protein n=1 Tax=Leisingera caerulea TaxID=506591 RepID=A0A9Q9HPM4_LEICA|nr:hypothetical protein [Leisingera caerulea]UWQ56506.1 hypothetical protein K3721_21480 [Leisingera caerulea]UWQ61062.1 hypothetical protein K3722_21780 [Leisingera caerulea]UWQ64743.1 hypothetical protein K3723_18925 [Leisingera caerulea]